MVQNPPTQNALTIRIEQPDKNMAQYTAKVTSFKGEAYHFFTLPENWTREGSLAHILNDFRFGVSTDRYAAMRGEDTAVLTPRLFGQQLFKAVLSNKVENLYRESLAAAQVNGHNLPVRLDVQPKTLAALPWEFLFDPQETTYAGYVCFGKETPIIRFYDKTPRPPTYDPPLRLLLLSANPDQTVKLNLQGEYGAIDQSLQSLIRNNKAKVEYLFGATAESLFEKIRNFKPHVVHFMGHGNVDQLMFEDGAAISSESLTINLRYDRSVRLVILNACQAGSVIEKSGGAEARIGVACSLAQAGIPAVVAMQFSISDNAAITFAKNLYMALADECPVDEAITVARIAMQTRLPRGSLEWATPVLYMQTPHGRLFDDLLKPQETTSQAETKQSKFEQEPVYETERRQSLKRRLTTLYKNLNKLEEQAAMYGAFEIPLRLSNEIDQTKADIEKIETELEGLTTDDSPKKEEKEASSREPSSEERDTPSETEDEDAKVRLEIYYQEGVRYFDKREWEKAIGFLQAAAEFDGNYRDINHLLKVAREKLQEKEEQRQRQNRLEILYGQAKQHFDNKRWREALDLLQVIQNEDSTFRIDETARMFREAQANHRRSQQEDIHRLQLETLYQRAKEAEAEQDWPHAVYVLEELDRQAPDGYRGSKELLRMARRQRQLSETYAQGLAAFEDNNWDDAVAYFGEVHAWDERYKDVNQKLEMARHEQNLNTRYQQGCELLNAGRWREAIEALKDIPDDDLRHRDAPLARNYAQAQLYIAEEEWVKAIPLLQTLAAAGYRDAAKQLKTAQQEKTWLDAFEQGQAAMQAGRWDDAIIAFKSLMTDKFADDKQEKVQTLLHQAEEEATLERLHAEAQRQLKLKHWDAAIEPLEQALTIRPNSEKFNALLQKARQEKERFELYDVARRHANRGEWANAVHKFEELAGKAPDFLDTQERLKEARRRLELFEAYRSAEEAMNQHQWEKVVILLQNVDEGFLDTADHLTTARRQVRLKQLYNEGDRHIKSQNWDEAIMVLEKLQTQLKPDNPLDKAYADTATLLDTARQEKDLADTYHLAQEAMSTQHWDEAIETLQKIVDVRRDYGQAVKLLNEAQIERDFQRAYTAGSGAYEAKNWPQAKASLTEALSYKPDHFEAKDMKEEAERQQAIEQALQEGQHFEDAENWAEAAKAYRLITRNLDPAHAEAIDRLNKVERQQQLTALMDEADQSIETENWAQAIKALEHIVQIDTAYNNVEQKLASAKQQRQLTERYQQAQANLKTGIRKYDREKLQSAIDLLNQIKPYETSYQTDVEQNLQIAQEELRLLDDYVLAQRLFNAEQWQEAVDKFQKIATHRSDYRGTQAYLKDGRLNQVDEGYWRVANGLLQRSEPSEQDMLNAQASLNQIIAGGPGAYNDKAEQKIAEIQDQLETRLQSYYDEMIAQAEAEQWREALEAFRKICAIDAGFQDSPSVLKQKMENAVDKYEQDEKFNTAQEIYELSQSIETILADQATEKGPWTTRIIEYLDNDETAEVRRELEALNDLGPEELTVRFDILVESLSQQSQVDDRVTKWLHNIASSQSAKRYTKQLIAYGKEAFHRKDWEGGLQEFEKVIKLESTNGDADEQIKLGELYRDAESGYERQNWQETEKFYEEIQKKGTPYHSDEVEERLRELHVRVGIIGLEERNWDDALQRFNRIDEFQPSTEAVIPLAIVYLESMKFFSDGEWDLACETIEGIKQVSVHFSSVIQWALDSDLIPSMFEYAKKFHKSNNIAHKSKDLYDLSQSLNNFDEFCRSIENLTLEQKYLIEFLDGINANWERIVEDYDKLLNQAFDELEIGNPYKVTGPVEGSIFVGRDRTLKEINQLCSSYKGNGLIIALHGHRRTGKTSIIRNLSVVLPRTATVVRYSMQLATTYNTYELFKDIAREIEKVFGLTIAEQTFHKWFDFLPSVRFHHKDWASTFSLFLDQLEQHRDNDTFLIIAIDEFEEIERGIERGLINKEIWAYLRAIIETRPWIALIFVGLRKYNEVAKKYNEPLYAQIQEIHVDYLSEAAAKQLIENPVPNFPVTYHTEVTERIIDLTGGQPHLIQLICYNLLSMLIEEIENAKLLFISSPPKVITRDYLDKVLKDQETYEKVKELAEVIWNEISLEGRKVLEKMVIRDTPWLESELMNDLGCDDSTLGELKKWDIVKRIEQEDQVYWGLRIKLLQHWLAAQG